MPDTRTAPLAPKSLPSATLIRPATRFVRSRTGRAAIIGVPAALVLVFTLILRAAGERERTTAALDAHAQRVRAETATFLAYLADAEAGQNGFLLTGRPVYLAPFVAGRPFLDSSLAHIRALTRANPTQQARLDTLASLARASLAFMDTTVEVRRGPGVDSAIARVESGRGRALMDEIHRIEQAISDEEARVLAARRAAAESERRRTLVWLLLGTISGILAVLFANLILADAAADEARARAAASAYTEQLERNQANLAAALTAGQTGTWDWDLRADRITWSDVHEMIFGYKPGTFSGTPAEFLTKVHPEDRAGLTAAFERARDERVAYSHDFRVQPTPGTIRWVAARGSFFYDDAGQPTRAAGTVTEITNRAGGQSRG